MPDHTPHQQRIIRRYYQNRDQIAAQRLGELVTEIYLAQGKKLEQLWKAAEAAMGKLGVSPARVEHIMEKRDPALLAGLMKEIHAKA